MNKTVFGDECYRNGEQLENNREIDMKQNNDKQTLCFLPRPYKACNDLEPTNLCNQARDAFLYTLHDFHVIFTAEAGILPPNMSVCTCTAHTPAYAFTGTRAYEYMRRNKVQT